MPGFFLSLHYSSFAWMNSDQSYNSPWLKYLPFALISVVCILGLFVDVMDVDASQYASIAKEMIDRGSFLELTDQGRNYLDKPPLLFWLSALSFLVFGFNNFAFKLPSFLVGLLGIYSTYRLAKLYYNERIAYAAALIYGSCQAFFLMCTDVRTDLLLTSFTVTAIYHLAAYQQKGAWKQLVLGFTAIGLAMLSKGPIGLVVPAVAIGADLVWKRAWKKIFDWKYIPGLLITGLVLVPMCIGLYLQYDSNPQVEVNGLKGVSGLKFFFWTQSFGRITGENVWKNDAGPFFLTESTLWAFLPYTLYLFGGLFYAIFVLFRNKLRSNPGEEVITLVAFLFCLLALSKSSYQLPHYIFIAYPFGAILAARFLFEGMERNRLVCLGLFILQIVVVVLLGVVSMLILTVVFPDRYYICAIFTFICYAALLWVFFRNRGSISVPKNLLFVSFLGILFFNIIMNGYFYPHLLKFQDTGDVGRFMKERIREEKLEKDQFVSFPEYVPHSLDFYTGRNVPNYWTEYNFKPYRNGDVIYVYANEESYERLRKLGYEIEKVLITDDYKVTELTPEFLNHKTRPQRLRHHYILKVTVKNQELVDFSLYK